MIDSISTFLTSIRNAVKVKKPFIEIYVNKITLEILKILKSEGFIIDYNLITNKKYKIFFKYIGWWDYKSYIHEITRISKPSKPIFSSYLTFNKYIPNLKFNNGIAIISTSHGLMSHYEAINLKKGGEILFYIK